MNEMMLKVEGITFEYKRKQPVFQDFSVEMASGQVIGLLGKNGTGKSTLLYLMCGLQYAKKGTVWMKGIDVSKRLPATLADTFLVPEEFMLPDISLKRFVELNAPFYPRFSWEDLAGYLRNFDLADDIHLGQLSMGQKKKVYMSFALASHTSLLLMDEPTNGLDIPSKSQFRKVIASSMNDECSIVISTHQVRDIDRLLDQVVIIDSNRVLLNQPVSRIVEKLYFAEQGMDASLGNTIYSQPSVQGYSVILPNIGAEESPLNLEVLFNATLADPDRMRAIFSNQ